MPIETWPINMPTGVTILSREFYDLHMTILYLCIGIACLVFSVMFYAVIRHRKSLGHQAAHFHSSLFVEITWTLIPFIMLVAMAVPATKTLVKMNQTERSDLTVKITGKRWFWNYEYINHHLNFDSSLSTPEAQINNLDFKNPNYLLEVDEPLVLPAGKKIRFIVTSSDVIHSWWVPQLGIKRDANPGFISEAWAFIDKPGRYTGQCAELCGERHGFMPIVVEAKTESEFQQWLNAKQQQPAG